METPLNVSWKSPERPLDTRLPAGPRDAGRSTRRRPVHATPAGPRDAGRSTRRRPVHVAPRLPVQRPQAPTVHDVDSQTGLFISSARPNRDKSPINPCGSYEKTAEAEVGRGGGGGLGAGGGDDRVGDEAKHEPEQDGPGDQFLELRGPGHGEKLDHDVEDGAGRQGKEGDTKQRRLDLLADDRAKEGGPAADQAEQDRPPP